MYEIVEWLNPDERHCHHVEQILHDANTAVQNVKIAKLSRYGRALLLNDRIQSTEFDERIYHEGIVLPALCARPNSSTVLCVGGANGGILRELVQSPDIKQICLVDLDRQAFEISKRFLPHMFESVSWDARIGMLFGDVSAQLAGIELTFDLIINDVADAIPGSQSVDFYRIEHFQLLKSRLSNGGVLVTQAGPVSHLQTRFFSRVNATLTECFEHVAPYILDIPSYGLPWGFFLASQEPIQSSLEIVRQVIQTRFTAPRTYDAETHTRLFSIPLSVRQAMNIDKSVTQQADQLYTFEV